MSALVIRDAADLEIGDILTDDGRDLVVTRLVPATREAALEYGAREVGSGSWWKTFDATEPVTAAPSRARVVRAMAAEQALVGGDL